MGIIQLASQRQARAAAALYGHVGRDHGRLAPADPTCSTCRDYAEACGIDLLFVNGQHRDHGNVSSMLNECEHCGKPTNLNRFGGMLRCVDCTGWLPGHPNRRCDTCHTATVNVRLGRHALVFCAFCRDGAR